MSKITRPKDKWQLNTYNKQDVYKSKRDRWKER
jgi:hypothetical protein